MRRDELIQLINSSSKVTAGAGTPNPDTREGIYLGLRQGLRSVTVFVGIDKTTGEFLIENVG